MKSKKGKYTYYINDEVYLEQINTGTLWERWSDAMSYVSDIFEEDGEEMIPQVVVAIRMPKEQVEEYEYLSDVPNNLKVRVGKFEIEPARMVLKKGE